jgi:hypothetical protein
MSNFQRLTKHPKTGKFELADWLDDYFGNHHYGVRFPSDQQVYDPYMRGFEVKDIELKKCSKCFALTTDLPNHECPDFMKLLINRSKKGKRL